MRRSDIFYPNLLSRFLKTTFQVRLIFPDAGLQKSATFSLLIWDLIMAAWTAVCGLTHSSILDIYDIPYNFHVMQGDLASFFPIYVVANIIGKANFFSAARWANM